MKRLRKNVSTTRKRFLRSSKRTCRDYLRFERVEKFVRRVRVREPLLVVLFGSVARRDFRCDSDADVFVVVEHPEELEQVYEDWEGGAHPVVKTFVQMDKFIREGEPCYIEMIEDGILLYEADGEFKTLSELGRDAKIAWGLERDSDGWRWKNDEPVWPVAG